MLYISIGSLYPRQQDKNLLVILFKKRFLMSSIKNIIWQKPIPVILWEALLKNYEKYLEFYNFPLYLCASSLVIAYQERQRVMARWSLDNLSFRSIQRRRGKGANSTPMVIGTDKSDPQLKISSKILKAHLIYRMSFFVSPNSRIMREGYRKPSR